MVPLNEVALTVLTAWASQFPAREDEHAVFPSEHVGASGDQFDARIDSTKPDQQIGSLKTAWNTAKRKAGLRVRWHDLRHSACTRLLEQGESLPMIGKLLGWSASTTVRMAQRYGHISQQAQREAMERLASRSIALPSGPTPKWDTAETDDDSSAVH